MGRGHTVTVLVRDPNSITPQLGLTRVEGSPLDVPAIERAFTATADAPAAVIIALSSRRASDSPFAASISPPGFMANSTANVVAAMRRYGVRRLVSLSSFGVGESNRNVWWPMRIVMNHASMNVGVKDHGMVEKYMRSDEGEGIEWVGVKPVMLTGDDKRPVRVLGEAGEGAGMMPSISRASVAGWIVDCVEDGKEWVGKTPVISN